ncbi:MAG: rod-binding protein [Mariprofundaceae bacterium]
MIDLVESVIGQVMRQDPEGKSVRSEPQENRAQFSKLLDQKVAKDDAHPDAALWKVSLQFESVLMKQLLESMRTTVPDSELVDKGFADDLYASMFDQAVADSAAKQSSIGIAEAIYRQMERSDVAQEKPAFADRRLTITEKI